MGALGALEVLGPLFEVEGTETQVLLSNIS